jgi:hypothetical protein
MLDKKTIAMLEVANVLTQEDLEMLQPGDDCHGCEDECSVDECGGDAQSYSVDDNELAEDGEVASDSDVIDKNEAMPADQADSVASTSRADQSAGTNAAIKTAASQSPALSNATQGERERMRTRESKISTQCVGRVREKHEWWPIGSELIGRIGLETFTARVVANPRVKSGRSLEITSGPATGQVCLTPTRAALEATEHYRQATHQGRSGGVTNGWTFWKPRA